MLTVTFPPLKGAGGMLSLQTVTFSHPVDHPISPFEGGWGDVNCQTVASPPLKEVRELAQRSMLIAKLTI